MRIHYEGKISPKNYFSIDSAPSSAQVLPSIKLFTYQIGYLIVLVIIGYGIGVYKHSVGQELTLSGLFVGFLCAIPTIIVHELLHAVTLPSKCHMYFYRGKGNILMFFTGSVGKRRYIFTLIAPTLVLGILPLFCFISFPNTYIWLNSFLFAYSCSNLGVCCGDFAGIVWIAKKMPKNSYVSLRFMNVMYHF